MTDVVIIDNGGANLASVQFAFQRLGACATVSSDAALIQSAPRVVLPGVGSAGQAMKRLRDSGIAQRLPAVRCPVLGICLGMQLLFAHSDEDDTPCLGILPGTVSRLHPDIDTPVPHMGWNLLTATRADPLLAGFDRPEHVYFVHSYAASVSESTLAVTEYGRRLPAVVRAGNFWGTQFHPERSAAAGARLLANFLRLH